MSFDLIETAAIKNPCEFMKVKAGKPSVAGERQVTVYLMCPQGCPNSLAVGDDQWNGFAPIQCENCKQAYYIDEQARLIPVKR